MLHGGDDMSFGEFFKRLAIERPRSMRLNEYFQEVVRCIRDAKAEIPNYKKSKGEIDWEELGPEFIDFVEKWLGRI